MLMDVVFEYFEWYIFICTPMANYQTFLNFDHTGAQRTLVLYYMNFYLK
jgi:hypothetical protein